MEKTNYELHFEERMKSLEFRAHYALQSTLDDLRTAITVARINAGMTQKELAGRLNTTQSCVSNLENVNSPVYPSLLTLSKVCDILGLQLEIKLK